MFLASLSHDKVTSNGEKTVFTESHSKEINFYFIDGYLMIKLKGQDN
ncbi:hypothetical protein SAMN05216491_2053 [Bacillus altitudinis]|nr:hypothetical protein SAMN05216491_2053 [Bacillus altitudinis]